LAISTFHAERTADPVLLPAALRDLAALTRRGTDGFFAARPVGPNGRRRQDGRGHPARDVDVRDRDRARALPDLPPLVAAVGELPGGVAAAGGLGRTPARGGRA